MRISFECLIKRALGIQPEVLRDIWIKKVARSVLYCFLLVEEKIKVSLSERGK